MTYLFPDYDMRDEDAEFWLPPPDLRTRGKDDKLVMRHDSQLCKFCGKARIYWRKTDGRNVPFNDHGYAHDCRTPVKRRSGS